MWVQREGQEHAKVLLVVVGLMIIMMMNQQQQREAEVHDEQGLVIYEQNHPDHQIERPRHR